VEKSPENQSFLGFFLCQKIAFSADFLQK